MPFMSVVADGELQRGQAFKCVVGLPKILRVAHLRAIRHRKLGGLIYRTVHTP